MSEIRISVPLPSLTGLDALTRKIEELQQKLASLGTAVSEASTGTSPALPARARRRSPTPSAAPVPPSPAVPGSGFRGFGGPLPQPPRLPGFPGVGPSSPAAAPTPPPVSGPTLPGGAFRGFGGYAGTGSQPPGVPRYPNLPVPLPSVPIAPTSPLTGFVSLPGGGIRLAGYTGAQTAGTYTPQIVAPPVWQPPGIRRPVPPPAPLPVVPQVDAITRALSAVDIHARRVFLTLRELSQRNRQQGFLGEEDQKTLLGAQRRWETLSRRLDADRQGSSARFTVAQAALAGDPANPLLQRQLATAQQQAAQFTQRQQGMARLEREIPGGGMPPQAAAAGWWGSAALGGAWTGARRFGGMALGLAAGASAFQLLSTAMRDYESRAQGALQVSGQLGLKYTDVDERIKGLRDRFHLLTQDSVAAMMALGRSTGNLTGMSTISAFARTYRMEPAALAGMYGQMSRLSTEQYPDLQAISLVQHQAQARGLRPLPMSEWTKAITDIATVGGTAAAPLEGEQYARFGALMTSMGGRFALQPAAAYEQFAAGMARPVNPAMQSLRERAVADVAARQPGVMLGKTRLNIRGSYRDYQMAVQQGWQIPEVMASYYEEALRQGGGNEDLQRFFWQGLTGEENIYRANQTFTGFQKMAQMPGGITANLRLRATTRDKDVQFAQEEMDRKAQGLTPAGELEKRAADIQARGELEIVATFEKIRNEFADMIAAGTKALNEQRGPLAAVNEGLGKLSDGTMDIVEKFLLLGRVLPVLGGTLGPLAPAIGALALGYHAWRSGPSEPEFQGGIDGSPSSMQISRFGPFYMPHLLGPDEYTTMPRKPS